MTKFGFLCSNTLSIVYSSPQRSIPGPILLYINIIELFLKGHQKSDFSNYADDAPYLLGHIFGDNIRPFVQHDITYLTNFATMDFKRNTSKSHLFLLPFNLKSIKISWRCI